MAASDTQAHLPALGRHARDEAGHLLQLTAVELIALSLMGKQFHWNINGPGFRELHLGHLTAAVAAVFSAGGLIALRMLGATEKRISVLGVTYATRTLIQAAALAVGVAIYTIDWRALGLRLSGRRKVRVAPI